MTSKTLFYSVIAFSLSAWLSACAPYLYKPGSYSNTPPASVQNSQQSAIQQQYARQLIKQSEVSSSPKREMYLLQAAYLLTEEGQVSEAQTLLMQLDTAQLTPETRYLRDLVNINIARAQGHVASAAAQIQVLTPPAHVSQTTQIIALELKANVYADQGDIVSSMRERILLDSLLTDEAAQAQNRQQISALASRMPPQDLAAIQNSSDPIFEGWTSFSNQPQHSVKTLVGTTHFRQIALLLPVSGQLAPSAESVRDGIYTAYNAAHDATGQSTIITVYDTHKDTQVSKTYKQAVNAGADLVIGPLTKNGVAQLNALPQLPVPVLALNYLSAKNRHANQLYEFGLAPEDEARSAAEFARAQGRHRALVLVQDDEWGRRVANAFIERWREIGGNVSSKVVFAPNDNMSHVVQQALHIRLTKEQMERLTSKPQRRQDLDMIFLASYPSAARQIKPLLNFYYADDIPVYGTSSLYALPPNVSLDRDLNGVYFCDMPWLLSPQSAQPQLHSTINELWPEASAAYARFFALGIDAYQLGTQLPELQTAYGVRYSGVTGQLALGYDDRIQRSVGCTRFQDGKPKR